MDHKQLLANYRRAVTRLDKAKQAFRRLGHCPDMYDRLERRETLAYHAYARALSRLNAFEQGSSY